MRFCAWFALLFCLPTFGSLKSGTICRAIALGQAVPLIEASENAYVGKDIGVGGHAPVFRSRSKYGEALAIKVVISLDDMDSTFHLQHDLASEGLAVRFYGMLSNESLIKLHQKFPIRPVGRYLGVKGLVFESLEGGWAVKEEPTPPAFMSKLDMKVIEAKLKKIGKALKARDISPFSDIQVMIMPDHRVLLIDLENFRKSESEENQRYGMSIDRTIREMILQIRAAVKALSATDSLPRRSPRG